jgi:hypothetical protein
MPVKIFFGRVGGAAGGSATAKKLGRLEGVGDGAGVRPHRPTFVVAVGGCAGSS